MIVTLRFAEGFPTCAELPILARRVAVLGQPETITRGPGGFRLTWPGVKSCTIPDPWRDGRVPVSVEVEADARAWAADWARDQVDVEREALDEAKRAVRVADCAYSEALKRANRLEAAAK